MTRPSRERAISASGDSSMSASAKESRPGLWLLGASVLEPGTSPGAQSLPTTVQLVHDNTEEVLRNRDSTVRATVRANCFVTAISTRSNGTALQHRWPR